MEGVAFGVAAEVWVVNAVMGAVVRAVAEAPLGAAAVVRVGAMGEAGRRLQNAVSSAL